MIVVVNEFMFET